MLTYRTCKAEVRKVHVLRGAKSKMRNDSRVVENNQMYLQSSEMALSDSPADLAVRGNSEGALGIQQLGCRCALGPPGTLS